MAAMASEKPESGDFYSLVSFEGTTSFLLQCPHLLGHNLSNRREKVSFN